MSQIRNFDKKFVLLQNSVDELSRKSGVRDYLEVQSIPHPSPDREGILDLLLGFALDPTPSRSAHKATDRDQECDMHI